MQVGKGKGLPDVFESADMSTTEGIMMRDRMVSLILPVLLQTVTAQITSLIPAQFNRSEMFRVHRVAGSSFVGLMTWDRFDYRYNGRYSVMDQMWPASIGDASKKQFAFDTAANCEQQMSIRANTVRVLHGRNVLASDNSSGNILGVFSVDGVTGNVSGTMHYASGKFRAAPAMGIEVHIGYNVDIVKDYKLIPMIAYQMESRVLIPSLRRATAAFGSRTRSGASLANSTSTAFRIRKNTPASPSPGARNTARPATSTAMPYPPSHSATPFWATS